MPSLRDIKRRIRATKNMAQITKAMQMVASSKMRRAQERVQQARPYAEQLRELVSRMANAQSESDDLGQDLALFEQRPIRNIGIIAITPDRGLSGALPSNVNRKVAATALELQRGVSPELSKQPKVRFVAVGRKGRDFLTRTEQSIAAEFTNYGERPSINDARAIAQVAVEDFINGEVDAVYVVYAQFINTVTQRPISIQLLPVTPPPLDEHSKQKSVDYVYEPDAKTIFEALLPRYVDVLVYQAMLEAIASQMSAQMVAMKNATDNANELIQDLTLTYNKARQSAITTQILEVVAGAGDN